MPWDDEQRGVAGFMVLAATLGAVVLIGGRTAKRPPDSSFLKKRSKKLSRLSTIQHGLVQGIVLVQDSSSDGGERCGR